MRVLCYRGRGEKEDAPLCSTLGQSLINYPNSRPALCPMFFRRLSGCCGLHEDSAEVDHDPLHLPPFFSYHPLTYATITIKDNGGHLKLSCEVIRGAGYCWC